jgi:hypothetical protein
MGYASRENTPGQAALVARFDVFASVFSPLYELINDTKTTDEVRAKALLALPIIAANVERARTNIVRELGEQGRVDQQTLDLLVMSNKRDLSTLLPEETDIIMEARFSWALIQYLEDQRQQLDGPGKR